MKQYVGSIFQMEAAAQNELSVASATWKSFIDEYTDQTGQDLDEVLEGALGELNSMQCATSFLVKPSDILRNPSLIDEVVDTFNQEPTTTSII